MKKYKTNNWEYWIVTGSPNNDSKDLLKLLNELGCEGWELVHILNKKKYVELVFKRSYQNA